MVRAISSMEGQNSLVQSTRTRKIHNIVTSYSHKELQKHVTDKHNTQSFHTVPITNYKSHS